MPNRIVVSKLGGPEVLKYENYDLPKNVEENMIRINQTSIGINYIDTYHRTGIYPLPVEISVPTARVVVTAILVENAHCISLNYPLPAEISVTCRNIRSHREGRGNAYFG